MQVALFGPPGTGKEQFSALLNEALKTAGIAVEIALPVALDVPLKADTIFLMGLQGTHAGDLDADIALRQLLDHHKLPYQVLYGASVECLLQAMGLIRKRLQNAQYSGALKETPPESHAESTRPCVWVWVCDKCSDPQCEHRLLTGLLASRSAVATGQLP